MTPGKLDLAGGRWVPFIFSLSLNPIDLTGATFLMQIRLTPDAPGVPLVSLGNVASGASEGIHIQYAGTDTVANHMAAGRLTSIPAGLTSGSSVAVTALGIRINESTMEGMPYPDELGDDAVLAWDMHITPSGGNKQKWLGGVFTVQAGVTQ